LQVQTRLLQASRTQPSSHGISLQAGVWQLLQTLLRQPCPGTVHVPQEPQPLLEFPQFCVGAQVGVQAVHTLATQVVPAAQLPQLWLPPHPFGTLPQVLPAQASTLTEGVQQVPPLQVGAPEGQVPQLPQPFGADPHVRAPQSGAQATQAPAVQVVPAAQLPQLMLPPQPLGALPHTCVPQAVALSFGVQHRLFTHG